MNKLDFTILKVLLVLISVSFNPITFSQSNQTFHHQMYQAKLLSQNGEIDSAIQLYESGFDKIEYVHSVYVDEILALSKKKKDKDRIKKYKRELYEKSQCKNPELKKVVDSLLKRDQMIRKGIYSKQIRYFRDCNEDVNCDKTSKKYVKAKSYFDDAIKTDSSNIQHILKQIKKYNGYHGEQAIGSKEWYNLFVMLLHFDTDTNNRILRPILTKTLNRGQITPQMFAQIIDRHQYNTSGTQTYWTWPIIYSDPELSEKDIDETIKKREKIGLFGSKRVKVVNVRGHWMLRQ